MKRANLPELNQKSDTAGHDRYRCDGEYPLLYN